MPDALAPLASNGRLTILESWRVLRIARGGRLQPWLGPALRGLTGGRLKVRACRHSVVDQIRGGRWERCKGCPQMSGWAYGETIEGEPRGVDGEGARSDATRLIVISPYYPCPEFVRVGDEIPLRVTFVGPVATSHAEEFWEALRVGGADPGLGLGEDRVLFDLLPVEEGDRTEEIVLPANPADVRGMLPRVRVVLLSPLILEHRVGNARPLIERPTLSNLLNRWEMLAKLFADYGTAVPAPTIETIQTMAASVPTLTSDLMVVSQVKSSHRTGERKDERGVIGWAEYGPFPLGLLPWLSWAGRLRVGTHRVAGAGGWRVEVI